MRWFAGVFFLIVGIVFALFAVVLLFGASGDSDTARGVVEGAGVLFAGLSLGAIGGGIWAFRRLGAARRRP
jgi:hypothetical protein